MTRTRWRKVAIALAVFVVALELVLQLGALVIALAASPAHGPAGAEVMCVGDSFTFGTGSSPGRDYPAELQRRLRAVGRDVEVANGGCPGEDSSYVLRRLPRMLRPGTQVLCVMVGVNDSWAHPDPVPAAELERLHASLNDDGRFVLRWRTGRLIALAFRFAAGSWARTGEAAPVPLPGRAGQVRADAIDVPAGFAVLEANAVIPAAPQLPVLPPPCPEPLRARFDEVLAGVHAHETARAFELASALAREQPASPHAWYALVMAANGERRAPQVEEGLAHLAGQAAAGDAAAAEHLALAAHAASRHRQAIDAAHARLAREPAAVMVWKALQESAYVLGDWDEFLPAAAATLRLAGRLSPAESALVARNYARALAARDRGKAAALLVAATLLDGNIARTRATVSLLDGVRPADLTAALATTTARPEAMAALREAFAALQAGEDASGWKRVLRAHLVEIDRIARQRGVRLVLASYPFFSPEIEATQREVAETLGVPFVAVRERFDRELQRLARADLFVRNGHCNDAGYAIVAEVVADAIAPLLAR